MSQKLKLDLNYLWYCKIIAMRKDDYPIRKILFFKQSFVFLLIGKLNLEATIIHFSYFSLHFPVWKSSHDRWIPSTYQNRFERRSTNFVCTISK